MTYAQLRDDVIGDDVIAVIERHRKEQVPLTVTCTSCGASGKTTDGSAPHAALRCDCCTQDHDHAGLGCRPVTISPAADLSGSAG
jgi:hypothetical protein